MDCYGKQHTIEKMREDKAEMFKKLKNKRNSKDYEWWFLRYRPGDSGAEKKKKRNLTEKTLKKRYVMEMHIVQTTVKNYVNVKFKKLILLICLICSLLVLGQAFISYQN